ncbi:transporter substrate-binding domain-containing protein [Pseudomaricurvus alkylphenolicus]|uniref:substrate-binding periplasmic protein n=1 Tax=Pseudomaricurvus alkylphenolicus TaxID=1306991 RepID=UPI00141F26C2|nr:transporter substrate-binding domain-containing protein [Pseudomaricurvus alkylphenolicus]NIB42948.1 transporter substrate-binding domain-containing protein [Pseudomaricurvus alkylphenolicus]
MFACTGVSAGHRPTETIKLSYGENSFAPYYYFDRKREPVGVMLDLVRLALSDRHIRFEAIDVPRKRLAEAFHSGTVDMDLMKREWLPAHMPVRFSRPAIPYTETLFVRVDDDRSWKTPHDLKGRLVCSHEGYVYGEFDRLTRAGAVHAVKSRSEVTMMKMLAHRRCDAAIGNRFPFLWLAAHMGYSDIVRPTAIEETFAAVPIMVHESRARYLPALDRLIGQPDFADILQKLTDVHLEKMNSLARDSLNIEADP